MPFRSIYVTGFDPRLMRDSREILTLGTLHLLLQERLAVQDAFLVSRHFQTADELQQGNCPREWLARDWLAIAMRDDTTSLAQLRDRLFRSAKAGKYEPFEGYEEGLRLYADPSFSRYLSQLDSTLSVSDRRVGWSTRDVGEKFAQRMRESAEGGESGLSSDRSRAIWEEIEAERESAHANMPHTSTRYLAYANGLDQLTRAAVWSWARREYLLALPDVLDLDLSAPSRTLQEVGAYNPFSELQRLGIPQRDVSAIDGRDCLLLNSDFLSHVSADGISTLRALPEFATLQAARQSGDEPSLAKALREYLRAIGDLAPGLLDRSVRRWEQLQFRSPKLSLVVTLGGILLSGPIGKGVAVGGAFVGFYSEWSKSKLEKAKEGAVTKAVYAPRAIAQFSHELEHESEGAA